MTYQFDQLRRRLALAGGRPAAGSSDAAHGRRDEAEFRLATLIDPPLRHIPVGAPEPWPGDLAFLDGTQETALLGYVGTLPVIAAVVRAAVRVRRDRRFTLAVQSVRRLVVARAAALSCFRDWPTGHEALTLDDEAEPHPTRDAQLARALVDRARARLEIEVARAFRTASGPSSWLIVDGSLSNSPDWSADPRMLAVAKSHAMLPFAGDDLELYLTLPAGHRTPLFIPESRRVTPLYSWALRLRDFAGRDLFHGLVRVEAPATDATRDLVDTLSRQLLAERAPLSNDPRADRLLYGIHDVERFLGAQQA